MKNETFGLMKALLDAHTMGIHAAAALLKECGYRVIVAPTQIEEALEKISADSSQRLILKWLKENQINHIGISYRLDVNDAINIVGKLVHILKQNGDYESAGATIKSVYFAGLAAACNAIDKEYKGRIRTFRGGESAEETLLIMGIPYEEIPQKILSGCQYDKELLTFGKTIIEENSYKEMKPLNRNKYLEYGTFRDSLSARLEHNFMNGFQPLIRAHSGPYSAELKREQCLKEYKEWCRILADTGYLDILSIGTSQLSQSNFGENWEEKVNGGGVPINSEQEFKDIWDIARPMLVRTYSGTKNVKLMAQIYEKNINIAWHALSLWWFDELDGRGSNSLYKNLKEHINTIQYIATTNKPVEANVSHHFAFRGCDDITYIISAYLAAKMIKKCGIKVFILQNMLNTPRSTWGIQDLAKSRALLSLVKGLEDDKFKVVLQTRAGLDFFKPDLERAKVQLAAVTAMMDDIEPNNIYSPEIIHVVSYSEALFLATPDILNDSIKITRTSLNEYRRLKKEGMTPETITDEINERTNVLKNATIKIIEAMERSIPNLYSPEGLYIAFVAGWMPVPELWSDSDEFVHAKCWETKQVNGGRWLTDHELILSIDSRINRCISYIPDAEYILKNKY
ncbi:cobalamin-binding protein [bacterium 1xD42-62]|uniref:Cobalamin-binding protein n=1 Tax=Parablautia muri TaxID=2320879 RepID=A0A9X5BCS0_9FIRM|nr:cobalamin-binding protein [Parablautia muri]